MLVSDSNADTTIDIHSMPIFGSILIMGSDLINHSLFPRCFIMMLNEKLPEFFIKLILTGLFVESE